MLVSAGVLNLFHVQILEQIGINIILAVGGQSLVSGQFSLGHAGLAIGAYAAAIIGSVTNLWCLLWSDGLGRFDFWCSRFARWDSNASFKSYLAVATLGVSEVIRIFIINGGSLTNGAAGILGIPNFTNWRWFIHLW